MPTESPIAEPIAEPPIEGQNFVAGRPRAGASTIENRNPSDLDDLVGNFAQGDAETLNEAFEAAKVAQRIWAGATPEARRAPLARIGAELMARADELGRLLSREEGKPFAEGRGEVFRAGQFFDYYAAEALRQLGTTADSVRPDIEIDVRREPVGIVAVISPWNFPTATASWKIAPALAFGNAVLWKPANLTPASAVALAEIISRSGLPEGLFNLVMGPGNSLGQALVEDPRLDAVSFTGSVEVGRGVATAAAANFTRIQLEMGSKNALAVADDADMELAVACAVGGAYGGTGQKCTASSRLVVHRKLHDEFVERVEKALRGMRVGHALEETTKMGPVASATQLEANLGWVERGVREGGTLVCGGERLERPTKGYYMAPALFAETDNKMAINRHELFAPIACVIRVDSYEEALAVVNDTEFGLTSGIMTRSLARAVHFRRNARTGCVMVNLPTAGTDYHVPFGGRGLSSYGPREQGRAAEEFYTAVKTAYIGAGKPV